MNDFKPQKSKIQVKTLKNSKENKSFIKDFNNESSHKAMALSIEEELDFCEKNLKSLLDIIADFKHKSIIKDSKIANYYALKLINLSEKICLTTRNIPHYIDYNSKEVYEKIEQVNEEIANA